MKNFQTTKTRFSYNVLDKIFDAAIISKSKISYGSSKAQIQITLFPLKFAPLKISRL